MTEPATANPAQIAEAWTVGVMADSPAYAKEEWRRYRDQCAISDPIYYRDGDGWAAASQITNPGAIARMRAQLAKMELQAPAETSRAWDRNTEWTRNRTAIARIVDETLRATAPGDTLAAMRAAVTAALENETSEEAR